MHCMPDNAETTCGHSHVCTHVFMYECRYVCMYVCMYEVRRHIDIVNVNRECDKSYCCLIAETLRAPSIREAGEKDTDIAQQCGLNCHLSCHLSQCMANELALSLRSLRGPIPINDAACTATWLNYGLLQRWTPCATDTCATRSPCSRGGNAERRTGNDRHATSCVSS
jgi:hypothetical protein